MDGKMKHLKIKMLWNHYEFPSQICVSSSSLNNMQISCLVLLLKMKTLKIDGNTCFFNNRLQLITQHNRFISCRIWIELNYMFWAIYVLRTQFCKFRINGLTFPFFMMKREKENCWFCIFSFFSIKFQ